MNNKDKLKILHLNLDGYKSKLKGDYDKDILNLRLNWQSSFEQVATKLGMQNTLRCIAVADCEMYLELIRLRDLLDQNNIDYKSYYDTTNKSTT